MLLFFCHRTLVVATSPDRPQHVRSRAVSYADRHTDFLRCPGNETFRVIVVKRHDNNNNNIDYGETAVHVRPENTRRHCRRRRRRRRITHRRSGIAGVAFLPSFAPFSGRTWNTRFENRLANVRVQGDSVREGRVMSVNSTRCKRKTAGWPRRFKKKKKKNTRR